MALSRKECSCRYCGLLDSVEMDPCWYRMKCLVCLRVENYEDFMIRNETRTRFMLNGRRITSHYIPEEA